MIKFEVGKVYERLDLTATVFKVCARTDKSLIVKMDYSGKGQNFEDSEFMFEVSMEDNIEVLRPIASSEKVLGRADKEFHAKTEEDKEESEANIEEVNKEDKEEEKKEELQKDSDDWIVGREYEAVCLDTNQKAKVKLIHYDKSSCYPLTFNSTSAALEFSDIFEEYKEIAFADKYGEECDKTVIVFKNGIKSILDWEESREPVCFEDGKIYKGLNEELFTCKTTFITANNEKVGIFYNEDKDAVLAQKIQNKNNVEYTYFMNTDQLDFIADEQYRDEIKALL